MGKQAIEWKRISVHELCEAIIDCVNKTAPTVEGPTPFRMIRTTNVKSGWVDTSTVNYVDAKTYQKWIRRGAPRRGDVILTREAPLGEVGLLRDDTGVFLGQRLVMYRANPKRLDNRFLLYSLLSHEVQGQIKSFGSGSTVEHMRVPDCENIEIQVPPLHTQWKIATILSAYDDLIENNLRRIKILEEMTQNLYREWFVKFRFPGHQKTRFANSPLGKIPEGWEVKKLGEILVLNYGKALKQEDRRRGNSPVYGSSGVVGYHDVPLVNGPGIIVGRKGNVGSIFWSDEDYYAIDTAYFVTSKLPLRFLFFDLQTKNFLNNDAAVPGLNRNQAYSLETVIPSLKILKWFCKFADDFERHAAVLRLQNTILHRTRDLLLPRLISGEVDVSELDITVPEEIVV